MSIKTAAGSNFTVDNPNSRFFGSDLHVNPKNDVGFFGGIKLGYVFGHGLVRPTIEGDFFYNGFRGGADFTLNEAFTPFPGAPTEFRTAQRNVTTWINTGAWLANFILRFAPGNQKFQPYLGAGVGIYYAESAGVRGQRPRNWRCPNQHWRRGKSCRPGVRCACRCRLLFYAQDGARLSSINTSIIRAPNSTLGKIALWANSWSARVSDSFSNAGNLSLVK